MAIDLEPSDGVFRYYWSDNEEMEWADGPFDSVELARIGALSYFQTKSYGPEPGDTIYIVRCDKRLTVAPDFSKSIEAIMEEFGEANEDCYSEDGFEGLVSTETTSVEQAENELCKLLKMAFEQWQSNHRKNIKTYVFGKVQDVEEFKLPSFGSEEADEAFIRSRSAKSHGMTLEQFDALRAGNTTTPTL